jgi:hypothetical protein
MKPNFAWLGGDNHKSSICVENMATAGRFALAQRNLENVLTDILSDKGNTI